MSTRRLLLVSGSLRRLSTNTALLRTVQAAGPASVTASFYDGLSGLPHFNPDYDTGHPPGPVAGLRSAIRGADAMLFSVPEYAGALPGSFKNLLDWTIGDEQAGSIYEKPVAWINASPRGAVDAHDSLRKVLGYAHATIVESACANVPVTAAMIGTDGLVDDPSVREQIRQAVGHLVEHLENRRRRVPDLAHLRGV
jgi:chromate reductase, NAD(P)H dehydrogenase (quinone)